MPELPLRELRRGTRFAEPAERIVATAAYLASDAAAPIVGAAMIVAGGMTAR